MPDFCKLISFCVFSAVFPNFADEKMEPFFFLLVVSEALMMMKQMMAKENYLQEMFIFNLIFFFFYFFKEKYVRTLELFCQDFYMSLPAFVPKHKLKLICNFHSLCFFHHKWCGKLFFGPP